MTQEAKISIIITRLKEVKNNNSELTIEKIADHTGVSKSTVARIFAEGSEYQNFKPESIEPIAKMLLGLDSLDEGDDYEKALKALIKLKDSEIEDLKKEKEALKEKYQAKMEEERKQFRDSLDFLKHQIELKDERMDRMFTGLERRGELYESLHQKYDELNQQHHEVMAQLVENQKLINKIIEKEE